MYSRALTTPFLCTMSCVLMRVSYCYYIQKLAAQCKVGEQCRVQASGLKRTALRLASLSRCHATILEWTKLQARLWWSFLPAIDFAGVPAYISTRLLKWISIRFVSRDYARHPSNFLKALSLPPLSPRLPTSRKASFRLRKTLINLGWTFINLFH